MNWKKIVVAIVVLLFLGFLAFSWSVGSGLKQDFVGDKSYKKIIPIALVGVYFSEHPNPEVEAKQKYCEDNFGRPKPYSTDAEEDARIKNYEACRQAIGWVVCDEKVDDLVPCIEKIAPNQEIKESCAAGQKAMQDLGDKVLSTPDLLVGLAFVGPSLGFRDPFLNSDSALAMIFQPPKETPAWAGIDFVGLHPAFVHAMDEFDACLKALGAYHK